MTLISFAKRAELTFLSFFLTEVCDLFIFAFEFVK
jgi:hypothetical protein